MECSGRFTLYKFFHGFMKYSKVQFFTKTLRNTLKLVNNSTNIQGFISQA